MTNYDLERAGKGYGWLRGWPHRNVIW